MPRVTVWTFGSKQYIQETVVCPLSVPSYKISIRCSERKLWRFPQVTCFECNLGFCKRTNFLSSYLQKYSTKSSKIPTWDSVPCIIKWVFFFCFWNITEKSYSENSTMTCLDKRNPRIQSSDTKCYETSSRKDRKYRSTP